ncbi:hypothetical protein KACHI17_10280 [Sediminibacterium sp. KACHI17]|uniref:GmrSD restriction endonucleases N-terminal domain-containing protein n=1 Tax=Sediminibacterium sp. KACHI17 TaxID=1751071 RepID=A0AAT9GHN7_9BACT
MYEIRPESIKTFVEDTSIKLPRYQRKLTWDNKKNFELCISIFKEYPMGVCILNVEKDKISGKSSKWLLDGRQRRNALLKIWEDPENIYLWGKQWIGIKNNDQPADVEDKYWRKINEYFEQEPVDEEPTNGLNSEILIEDQGDEDENIEDIKNINEVESAEAIEMPIDTNISDLGLLLEIIKLIHNKTTRYSGFTRPFDFEKVIPNLPYEILENGKKVLNSKKLVSFMNEYKTFCKNEVLENDNIDSFKEFLNQRFTLNNNDKVKISALVDQNWNQIKQRFEIIEKITSLLITSKIGLIEVKGMQLADSQKIFNIINSKGTSLTAIEILSAKPSWNSQVKNPTNEQIQACKLLYKSIAIKNDSVVKWDLPASLIFRLTDANIFFKKFTDNKTDFEKQTTLGFKILSGIYEKGVKKDDIDKLSKNQNINWDINFESLVNDLNLLTKVILSSEYFKFLKSWQTSIMSILSDAIALDFVILMYFDWIRKSKPVGSDANTKMFQKNAYILLDKLVFEYVTKQWRGSSDSKIAQNIKLMNVTSLLFDPISTSQWVDLLNNILDTNQIGNTKINQGLMEPILYHFYATRKIQGPDSRYSIEVDHIIPQAIFKNSILPDKESLQHNLFNLGLLPKDENISKSNKTLIEIRDQWLKNQIEKYEFIASEDFQKFSDLNNLDEFKAKRRVHFTSTFIEDRSSILNN